MATPDPQRQDGFISGVILAAGLSRRMGRPKLALPLGGKPLLQYALDAAAKSRLDEIVLVVAPPEQALLATLEPLSPAERVAYVLHDLLGHHFEDVAGVLGRTSAATRELAARARARVTDGATSETAAEDAERRVHGALVAGVLGAASSRDDEGLRALLADDVRLRADAAAVGAGVEVYREGRADVAETVAGLAGSARLVRLDGYAAAEVDLDGTRAVVGFVLDRAHAVELDVIAEPAVLDLLDLRAG